MRFEFDGAIATAIRPYGFFGKPLLFSGVISFHVFPPSFERNNPLPEGAFGPSPPQRKVHPLRRKSQRAANMTFESFGSTTTVEQPVERLLPLTASAQFLPPSVVRYKPRSAESLQSAPGTAAKTVLPFLGSTAIRAMRSDFSKPLRVHVSPPSLDL